MARRLLWWVFALLLGSCAQEGVEGLEEGQLPLVAEFTNEVLAPGISRPMSLRFLPDGRLLILRKTGEIMIGDPEDTPPMDLQVYMALTNIDSEFERGLFDIALDPNFARNGQFYLLYTASNPRQTRVSKFTHVENQGGLSSRGQLNSEKVLWQDTDGFPQCCHYGGSVDFGPDGKLYVSIGDKFEQDVAQNLNKPSGSLLRINADGTIPQDNPFVDGNGPKVDAIWAYGLRNPFRARWDLPTDRLFISEVGGNDLRGSYEDLHVATSKASGAGMNFGWPLCEGPPPYQGSCASLGHQQPLYTYPHAGTNAAIIGGRVYRGSQFPSAFKGRYFFGDFSRETIRYLTFDSNGKVNGDHIFEDKAGPVVALEVGPDGMLYYLTISGGVGRKVAEGDLRRIYFNSGNEPPEVADIRAEPAVGAAPLQVKLTARVVDAEGDAMTYAWDFADGQTSSGQAKSGDTITVNHRFSTNGQYEVQLRVSDGQRATSAVPATVRVGAPPKAKIVSPVNGSTFNAGQKIRFSAEVDDPDERFPERVTYSWLVQFGHDNHFHPVLGPVSLGAAGATFDVNQAAHDFLGDTDFRIDLTVTDSDGLTDQTFVEIRPRKVNVSLVSNPPGAEVTVDAAPVQTPRVLDSLVGWKHRISATASRCVNGTEYAFDAWSDGGAMTHDITVPAQDATITARYRAVGSCISDELPVQGGLVFRVRADEGVSTNAAGALTQWADQGGNGHHLGVVSGAPQRLSNAINGHAAVRFDGADDALGAANLTALPSGAADRTVMMVARYQSGGWGGFTWGKVGCNQAFGVGVSKSNKLAVQGWCKGNDHESTQTPDTTRWVIHSAVLSANQLSHYMDGTRISTFGHTYATGNALLRLGRNLDDTSFVKMDVAEVLVFGRALADSERAQLETHLQQTYLGTGGGGTDPTPPPTTEPCVGSACVPVTNGLVFWVHGDQGLSTTTAGVSRWADQSPKGNHLQVTSGAPQARSAALNGHRTVRFDGVDDGLGLTSPVGLPTGSQNRHVFVVAKYNKAGARGWAGFAWGTPTCNGAFGSVVTPAGQAAVQGWCGANDFASSRVVNGQGFAIHEASLSSNTLTHSIGGVQVGRYTHTFATGSQRLSLGAELNDRERVDMEVAAVIVYNRALSSAERSQVLSYLNGMYLAGAGGPSPTDPSASGPAVTQGLVLWLRSDLGLQVSGSNVVQWSDQSGASNHLSVTSGNPVRATAGGPGGQPYVSFDGVDDGLGRTGTGNLPTGAAARTVFMVARYDSLGWGGFVWGDLTCNHAFGTAVDGREGNLAVQGWCPANDFSSTKLGKGAGFVTHAAVYNGTTVLQYLNGTQIGSNTHAFDTGSARVRLGVELNDRAKIDMDVAEVLVYNRALSATERGQVQSYLTERY